MATTHDSSSLFSKISQAVQIPQQRTQPSRPKQGTSTPILLLSSAAAGGVEALATYPFEYAKTLVQLQTAPSRHNNPFSVIYQVARHDGISTIYTGCSILVAGTAFKVSVRFASYSYFRRHLVDELGTLTPMRGVLAGSLAGLTESVVAVTPTERLKTLLIEAARTRVNSFRNSACHCGSYYGIRGQTIRSLYIGLLPTVLKQSTTQGVKMGSYNVIKEVSRRYEVPQNSVSVFVTGALAGIVTVYVTQPFDTVKTWAQSARGAGMVEAVHFILLRAGVRGMWSGSTSRVGRLAFSSSILYTVYEKVATSLDRSLEQEVFVFTQRIDCEFSDI
jgi:solute carrier family 25 citrate transporter 1